MKNLTENNSIVEVTGLALLLLSLIFTTTLCLASIESLHGNQLVKSMMIVNK